MRQSSRRLRETSQATMATKPGKEYGMNPNAGRGGSIDVAGEPRRQLAVDQHRLRRLAGIVDDLLREAFKCGVRSIGTEIAR